MLPFGGDLVVCRDVFADVLVERGAEPPADLGEKVVDVSERPPPSLASIPYGISSTSRFDRSGPYFFRKSVTRAHPLLS